jgi:hypothetical protein
MRRFSVYVFFVVLLVGIHGKADGQCKAFARRVCKLDLEHFIHDGNYHAAILTEGEDAELYKTFYADQTYRIAICADILPAIEFKVMDIQRNILYNNRENDFSNTWDFRLESSQQLMISISVPGSEPGSEPGSGCVAILFGLSDR